MIKMNTHIVFNTVITSVITASVIVLSGCGAVGVRQGTVADNTAIESAFFTSMGSKIDRATVSFHRAEDGSYRAVAPVKGTDTIVIYDAEKTSEVRKFGASGLEKGQFGTPVDTESLDNLLFVLERSNHRIQVFHLPEMKSFGFFGEDRLTAPARMALYRIENGAYYLYVSDTIDRNGESTDYILRFSVSRGVNTIHGTYLKTFGYSPDSGYLNNVQSIDIDQAGKRVLVETGGTSRAFSLEGDTVR